jgi:hypothetical protein
LKLYCLKVVDVFAKLFTLSGVSQRALEGAARDANHLGANADAAFVQSFD